MFVVLLPVLILFVGLTLDFGMAFVTKTALSKAADAAAITAMRNVKQRQSTAIALARNAFNANYAAFGNNSPVPTVNIAFTTDSGNNQVANVNATATLNSFFLSLLPGFKTISVSTGAQTTRPKLMISLVLDRSGSMTKTASSGGSMTLNNSNLSNDAMYRANQAANSMRAQGIIVYSIGLGDKISQPFLQQFANDPASNSFDSTQPIGEAVFAPTSADLQGVFQDIANKILLRLSQ